MAAVGGTAAVNILWCAQCENAPATLECFEEELLYCAPCSTSLHSKRARLHHCVTRFRICDECEGAIARLKCACCAGKQGEPLVFCASCSALLHSKKARHQHCVEALDGVEAGERKGTDGKEGASLSNKQGAVSTTTREVLAENTNVSTLCFTEIAQVARAKIDKDFSCAEKPITQELNEMGEKGAAPAITVETETVAHTASPGPITQELHEIGEKGAAPAITVQTKKVAHTTPPCSSPNYPHYPPAPFSWHPFTGSFWPTSANIPPDGPQRNPGNVPLSCHPHGMSNPSGLMSNLHQFPVYYPSLGLFFPASHGTSERAEPFAPQYNVDSVVFKSEEKADTVISSHQQPERMSKSLHDSCLKKRSRPDSTETSPSLTASTPQPELSSQCFSKKMHNAHTEVQRSDLEKGFIEIEHGTAPMEDHVESEHKFSPMEGLDELSPSILHTGDLSERVPIIGSLRNINEVSFEMNDATRIAIGEQHESDPVERSAQHCMKVSQGEGISKKEPTSGLFGKALPNIGSCSKSSNQVNSEVSLGQRPPSEAFSELVSAANLSSDAFGKVSTSNLPCGHVPSVLSAGLSGEVALAKLSSTNAPEELASVLLDDAFVEKVSIDDALAKDVPGVMRLPKEEPVDNLEQAHEETCEGYSGMYLREKTSCRVMGKTSPKLSAVNTLHENTRRSRIYPLRNSSARKPPKAKNEANKSGKDSSEESYSEGDTSTDDKTFNAKNYRRGSVTLEAVVIYTDDYDVPSSTIGRIVRSLEHGLLFGTSDADARQVVKVAQRHLTKYNLKQACTLEGGLQNTQNLRAGSCVVEFVSTGPFQRSCLETWTYKLALSVAKYFASNYCAQNLKIIFYGIEQNASCAAHAFAATFNRVTNLSADFVPEKLLDEGEIEKIWECPNKSVFCRKSRMAYRNDLVDALYRISESSRWQQEVRTSKMPEVVRASPNWVRNGISFVPVCSARSIWLEGVPKNTALVKKYGYEAVKALALHSRKVCKAFLENEKWTVTGFKLKDPLLS